MVRGTSHAATADFDILLSRGQDDVDQPYLAQFLEYPMWFIAQPGGAGHLMQYLPKDVGQEADQDVSLHPLLGLVPNRADSQVALVNPKRRFGVGQLDVRLPEVLGRPVHDIRAAQDAIGPAVTPFHRGDDFLPRRHVIAVAGEDFIAERDSLSCHDQSDADLLAIGSFVAGVAALGLRIALAKPFKIGARHVVQQQIVIPVKERAEAVFQVSS